MQNAKCKMQNTKYKLLLRKVTTRSPKKMDGSYLYSSWELLQLEPSSLSKYSDSPQTPVLPSTIAYKLSNVLDVREVCGGRGWTSNDPDMCPNLMPLYLRFPSSTGPCAKTSQCPHCSFIIPMYSLHLYTLPPHHCSRAKCTFSTALHLASAHCIHFCYHVHHL